MIKTTISRPPQPPYLASAEERVRSSYLTRLCMTSTYTHEMRAASVLLVRLSLLNSTLRLGGTKDPEKAQVNFYRKKHQSRCACSTKESMDTPPGRMATLSDSGMKRAPWRKTYVPPFCSGFLSSDHYFVRGGVYT